MPGLKIGSNLWNELGYADVILVTTNAYVDAKGAVVMGRGAALEAKQQYPEFPFQLARAIGTDLIYGVRILPQFDGTLLGAFQVKSHFRLAASPNLIATSAKQLATIATALPNWRFAMNYPGIGNGRLEKSLVRPILDILPDNVILHTLE